MLQTWGFWHLTKSGSGCNKISMLNNKNHRLKLPFFAGNAAYHLLPAPAMGNCFRSWQASFPALQAHSILSVNHGAEKQRVRLQADVILLF